MNTTGVRSRIKRRHVASLVLASGLPLTACSQARSISSTSGSGGHAAQSPGRWTGKALIDGKTGLSSISCPTPTFCVAVDLTGAGYMYSRGSWSPSPGIAGASTRLHSVSCSSTKLCVAVGQSGQPFTLSNGRWITGPEISSGVLSAISCTTTNICMAVGWNGHPYVDSAGTWSSGGQVTNSSVDALTALSCPTTTFCMAVDYRILPHLFGRQMVGGKTGDSRPASAAFGVLVLSHTSA